MRAYAFLSSSRDDLTKCFSGCNNIVTCIACWLMGLSVMVKGEEMENLAKRQARLILIECAARRMAKKTQVYPGKYWKEVQVHKLLDARCLNRGEPVPASRW